MCLSRRYGTNDGLTRLDARCHGRALPFWFAMPPRTGGFHAAWAFSSGSASMRQISPTLTATGKNVRRRAASSPSGSFITTIQQATFIIVPPDANSPLPTRSTMRSGRGYREYCGGECGDCALRSQCTDSVRGRTLKRYVGEEFREWMAELLDPPLARARYRRRQA